MFWSSSTRGTTFSHLTRLWLGGAPPTMLQRTSSVSTSTTVAQIASGSSTTCTTISIPVSCCSRMRTAVPGTITHYVRTYVLTTVNKVTTASAKSPSRSGPEATQRSTLTTTLPTTTASTMARNTATSVKEPGGSA